MGGRKGGEREGERRRIETRETDSFFPSSSFVFVSRSGRPLPFQPSKPMPSFLLSELLLVSSTRRRFVSSLSLPLLVPALVSFPRPSPPPLPRRLVPNLPLLLLLCLAFSFFIKTRFARCRVSPPPPPSSTVTSSLDKSTSPRCSSLRNPSRCSRVQC